MGEGLVGAPISVFCGVPVIGLVAGARR